MTRFISFLLILITPLFLNAQIKIAPTAGINISDYSLNKDIADNIGMKNNYFLGLHSTIPLSTSIDFVADVEYSLRGFSRENADPFNLIPDVEYRVAYLDFQPYIQFQVTEDFSVGGGFFFGFNLDEDYRFGLDGDWLNNEEQDAASTTDVGMLFNARYTFDRLFVFLEYNHGYKNIGRLTYSDANGEIVSNARQRLRNFQLGIGFYLISPEDY
ncbi:MAG: outer membrane beta-barrel protein [Saprospiraceae bacterium]|nr:outer membrane beta-barrel protein [Saprospiraceae bacterium]